MAYELVYRVEGTAEIQLRNGGWRTVDVLHEIAAPNATVAAERSLVEVERAARYTLPNPQPRWVQSPRIEVLP